MKEQTNINKKGIKMNDYQLQAFYEIVKEIEFNIKHEKEQIKAHRYAIQAMKKSIERYREKIKELEAK